MAGRTLQLTNTLTRVREPLVPLDPGAVRLYVCGPTVYDYAHIGNARTFSVFDVLARLLRHLYGAEHVIYVRNITDVDDKIIDRSRESGEPIEGVTSRTLAQFHADMDELGLLRPDIEPRATLHIPEMVQMIGDLIGKGFAYAAEGHVLFHVPAMPDYGRLSRRSQDELVAGARVEVAPYKRDPSDFVLWKPSTPDQPGWDSPWGRGRPGWHIECSAMAGKHLGPVFDIHGGGLDLIFPHHENEIAQSRCAHGTAAMASIWMHTGFLTVAGDKMSKSAGNFYTVRELLDEFPAEAIRLSLLTAHYRQPLDFTKEKIGQAKGALDGWYGALRKAEGGAMAGGEPDGELLEHLCNDLNTPEAIARLHALAAEVNKADDGASRDAAAARLRVTGGLLGLLQADPAAWFRWAPAGAGGLDEAAIQQAIADRLAAKKAKNFGEADRIRAELLAQGVVLEDAPGGITTWKRG